jgi:sulfoxide reductase heme-binding subunit YedZ
VSLAVAGGSAAWYLARGTGVVSLLLLTLVIALGLAGPLRVSLGERFPRFAIDTLHRDLSLLAVALLAVHIITSVLDSFAPIRLIDAVVPFTSSYRPLWLGFGALAFDVILALVATSLVRRRLGYGSWRMIHWLAYLCWPVAVLHGLGTGTDVKTGWMLLITAICVGLVSAAIVVFTLQGPLKPHWAQRAGTPPTLLGAPRRHG